MPKFCNYRCAAIYGEIMHKAIIEGFAKAEDIAKLARERAVTEGLFQQPGENIPGNLPTNGTGSSSSGYVLNSNADHIARLDARMDVISSLMQSVSQMNLGARLTPTGSSW